MDHVVVPEMGNLTPAADVITWEVIAARRGGGHTGSIVNPPRSAS
jgi:hypothetical protein